MKALLGQEIGASLSRKSRSGFALSARSCVRLAAMGLLQTPTVFGAVWYVDANATGTTHNGTAWCSAFVDLQDALDVALTGDVIRIADGIYTPDRGTGDPTLYFAVGDGVSLFGGYAGCGAVSPDERDPVAFETILSGDLDGDDAVDSDVPEENSWEVLKVVGGLVDGFSVTGAKKDDCLSGCAEAAVVANGTVRNVVFHAKWDFSDV